MSSRTRARAPAEQPPPAATTAAAQSTPVEPAASTSVASSVEDVDADLSPFLTPGVWRRVCFLICSHCQYVEFPGCGAHTQLYSQPAFVVSPPAAAAAVDDEDRSSVRKLSMGCGACQDSTDNTLPFSSLCRGCHTVRSTAHSMMLCETQLALLQEAILHHEIAQLIETAVLHCRQCGAVEFPTVAQLSEEIAAEAAAEAAAATRAASSLEATVAAAFASSSAPSSSATTRARVPAASAAPSAAAVAVTAPPAGFLFNKLGEISNAQWLLGSETFQAIQREYENECRVERAERARALEIEQRQARERIAQDAAAAAAPAASSSSASNASSVSAVPRAEAEPASSSSAVRVATPLAAAPDSGAAASSSSDPLLSSGPLVLTALESERLANRLVARCKSRFLSLHGSHTRHYFAQCTGEWSIKLTALSFSECAFLRKHFLATPTPPLTHRYRIHDAARRGDSKALETLLRMPHLTADPQLLRRVINQREQSGKTALHIAAFYGRFSCLQLLVNHPLIDLHLLDRTQPRGWTALDHALYWKHGACIKALLWAGAGSRAPYRDLHSLDALVWNQKTHAPNKAQNTPDAATTATACAATVAAPTAVAAAPTAPSTAAEAVAQFISSETVSASASNFSSSAAAASALVRSPAGENSGELLSSADASSSSAACSSVSASSLHARISSSSSSTDEEKSSSSMSAGQSSAASSLQAPSMLATIASESVAVDPPAPAPPVVDVVAVHAMVVAPAPADLVAADAAGPPAIAMQHLAQAQQRAGDADDGSHAAATLGGYPIDPLELVQSEQGKLMFLLGLHRRVGADSALYNSLACNSAFERNLIRSIFAHLDPYDYSYCLARSAEARHTAEVLVTSASAAAARGGARRDSVVAASSSSSTTAEMDAAAPANISDPMQPFQISWTSESTTAAAATGSAVAAADPAVAPSSALNDLIGHDEFDFDEDDLSGAATPSAAASTDPDVAFLLGLIPLYTPRTLKLPTDLMPFVPQFYLPVELPRGSLDEMLKPRPPSEIPGLSISVSTLSSRSKQNLAVADGLGVVELDEVRVAVQSDPDELRDKWDRAREKSQRKSQQSAARRVGGGGAGARPSPLLTSLRSSPRPDSRDSSPKKSDLRGELFSLLAPFKSESKAAAAAARKRASPSSAASSSVSPAAASSFSLHSPHGLTDPPSSASSVRASTTHLLSPLSPASASSPQSAVSPSAVQLSVLSPSPSATSSSSISSSSSPAATVSASSMDASSVVSSAAYHELLAELQRKTDALHRISELIEDRPESAAALSAIPPLRFFQSTPPTAAFSSSRLLPSAVLDDFPLLSPSSSDSSSSDGDDEAVSSRPTTSSRGLASDDALVSVIDSTAGVKIVDSLSRGNSRAGGPRYGRRAVASTTAATATHSSAAASVDGSSTSRSLESATGRRRAAAVASAASGSQTARPAAASAASSSSSSVLSASAVAARRAIAHSRVLNSPTAKWFH